jgi:hypothetical protein
MDILHINKQKIKLHYKKYIARIKITKIKYNINLRQKYLLKKPNKRKLGTKPKKNKKQKKTYLSSGYGKTCLTHLKTPRKTQMGV